MGFLAICLLQLSMLPNASWAEFCSEVLQHLAESSMSNSFASLIVQIM